MTAQQNVSIPIFTLRKLGYGDAKTINSQVAVAYTVRQDRVKSKDDHGRGNMLTR